MTSTEIEKQLKRHVIDCSTKSGVSLAVATMSAMLTNAIGIMTLCLTAIATAVALEKYSWKKIVKRRIAEYLERSRDLPCPRQRQLYEKKVTREVWFEESLTRCKSRRKFGRAMALMSVASAALLVATFPWMASSGNPVIIVPLLVAFFAAGVNYIHVLHCLSVSSLNRVVFTALRGRDAVPVLEAPSFWAWVLSIRHLIATFTTSTGLEVLSVAADYQRANGRRWLPELVDLDDAQQYAHLLDAASLAAAMEELRRKRRLGGSSVVGA